MGVQMQNIHKISRVLSGVVFFALQLCLFPNMVLFANIDEMEKVTEKIEVDLKKFGHVISTADGHLSFQKKSPTPSEFSNVILGYLKEYPSVEVSGYMTLEAEESDVKNIFASLKSAGIPVKQVKSTQLRLSIRNLKNLKLISETLLGQSPEVLSVDLQFNPVDGDES